MLTDGNCENVGKNPFLIILIQSRKISKNIKRNTNLEQFWEYYWVIGYIQKHIFFLNKRIIIWF